VGVAAAARPSVTALWKSASVTGFVGCSNHASVHRPRGGLAVYEEHVVLPGEPGAGAAPGAGPRLQRAPPGAGLQRGLHHGLNRGPGQQLQRVPRHGLPAPSQCHHGA